DARRRVPGDSAQREADDRRRDGDLPVPGRRHRRELEHVRAAGRAEEAGDPGGARGNAAAAADAPAAGVRALPAWERPGRGGRGAGGCRMILLDSAAHAKVKGHRDEKREVQAVSQTLPFLRSDEHTSALQSREKLVCRLLLEKKKI